MKKLMFAVGVALTASLASADTLDWFNENFATIKDNEAWALNGGTLEAINGKTVSVSSADDADIVYTPVECKADVKTLRFENVCLGKVDELPSLNGEKAGVLICEDEFYVISGGEWQNTGVAAEPSALYTITAVVDSKSGTVNYVLGADELEQEPLFNGSIVGTVSSCSFRGFGTFEGIIGTYEGEKPVKGLTYDTAFESIDEYNEAMASDLFETKYSGQDVYVVIRDFAFQKGVDYSPLKTNISRPAEGSAEPKLHAFFYNCTFPGGDEGKGGVMGSNNDRDPMATNRKQINLLGVKEAWVEGCTFEAFNGDSYVIDFNLSTKCDNEGCGITITNNTFKTGAGKRVPISVKNKADKDPAFVKIVDNYFAKSAAIDGSEIQANAAGVLCFADQNGKGANFPITVENNRFEEGTETYVIMTGYYVESGKEKIFVPVDQAFTWAKEGDEWVATPAFHPAEEPVVPGEPTVVEAKDEAEALKKVDIVVPAGVTDAEAYKAMFVKSAVEIETGVWAVSADLAPAVKAEVEAAVETAEAEILATPGEAGEVEIATKAGLFYSAATGKEIGAMEEGDRTMGDGKPLKLDIPAIEGAKGFYEIKVNATPKTPSNR